MYEYSAHSNVLSCLPMPKQILPCRF